MFLQEMPFICRTLSQVTSCQAMLFIQYIIDFLYGFQNLIPDYSMSSHAKDLENYVNVARNRRRRAKALLDFERHDDDELGFRKNDVITVSGFVHSVTSITVLHQAILKRSCVHTLILPPYHF